MSTYNHLTQEERYHIETLRKQKVSLSKIAAGMGRHKSTLSRELRRNQGQRGYFVTSKRSAKPCSGIRRSQKR